MDRRHLSKFRNWVLRSPPADWALSALKDLLIGALRQGPVPRHIAFVMDGNRRFAREHRLETIEGHNLGFEALAKILEVCYQAGVEVVTVYAFSIENFKRSKYEVDALMDMARLKIAQMAQHGDLLDRYGACIRFLGNKDLLKPEVRRVIDRAVQVTKHNKTAVFNVCCPYTSRDEITTAIRSTVAEYSSPMPSSKHARPFSERSIAHNIRARRHNATPPDDEEGPRAGGGGEEEVGEEEVEAEVAAEAEDTTPEEREHESASTTAETTTTATSRPNLHDTSPFSSTTTLNVPDSPPSSPESFPDPSSPLGPAYPDPEKIDAATLTSHMFTAGMPPLDLLVRTSGVERLSDFMLWQCHEHTSIVFRDCLWPQFDLWQFLPVLVEWQWWQRKAGRAEVAV